MRFTNGHAEFSEFEQRRFGVEHTVDATNGEQSFVNYKAAREVMMLQVHNHAALEKAGVVPENTPEHMQHAAHTLGFLSVMADQRAAYLKA